MIQTAPEFVEGKEFRRNRDRKWRYTTLVPIQVIIDARINRSIVFTDEDGKIWAGMEKVGFKTLLTIVKGYSWDGATCAPDFNQQLAALVHDVLYQFLHTEHFPFSRRECDDAFYDLMKLSKFPLARVYRRAVRIFGGHFAGPNGTKSYLV